MKTVNDIMTALDYTFDADRDGLVELVHHRDSEYPDGFLGVLGEFDDIDNVIHLTLVSNTDENDGFDFESNEAQSFFEKELDITLAHEQIHREQFERGENFNTIISVDDERGHYGNVLEIEAYGRADMFKEVNWYDLYTPNYEESVTLALYKSIFGAKSCEVSILTQFCEKERDSKAIGD